MQDISCSFDGEVNACKYICTYVGKTTCSPYPENIPIVVSASLTKSNAVLGRRVSKKCLCLAHTLPALLTLLSYTDPWNSVFRYSRRYPPSYLPLSNRPAIRFRRKQPWSPRRQRIRHRYYDVRCHLHRLLLRLLRRCHRR